MKKLLLLAAPTVFLSLTPVAFAQDGGTMNIDPPCFGSATCSTEVPEPGTLGLFMLGVGGLVIRHQRKKR
jgi:PEP-CTERM motif